MSKYKRRDFQIGEWYILERTDSPAFYRTRWDKVRKRTETRSLGVTDYQAAKEALTEWYYQNTRLVSAEPEAVGLKEILWRYYEKHGKNLPSEEQIYIAIGHLLRNFGDLAPVSDLNHEGQETYIARRRGQGISDNTIGRELSVVRAALKRAHKLGEMRSVPFIQSIETSKPRERRLSMDEISALLDVADPHLWDFIMVACNTLARPDAILDLEVSQCDFENSRIRLNPSGRMQTKKFRPVVPMTDTMREILDPERSGFVVNYQGRQIKSIKTAWRRARERVGLGKDVIPYTIRHTMATELRRRGVPQWEVAGWLGHKGGVTEVYAQWAPDYLAQGRVAIDAYFSELLHKNSTAGLRPDKRRYHKPLKSMVGAAGIEPATPTMST